MPGPMPGPTLGILKSNRSGTSTSFVEGAMLNTGRPAGLLPAQECFVPQIHFFENKIHIYETFPK